MRLKWCRQNTFSLLRVVGQVAEFGGDHPPHAGTERCVDVAFKSVE